jgi:hypothetical protein
MPVQLPTTEQSKRQAESWAEAEVCNHCDRRVCICDYLKRIGKDRYFQRLYPKNVYEQQARVPHLSLEEVYHRLYREEAKTVVTLYTSTPFFKEIAFSFANNRNYRVIYKN